MSPDENRLKVVVESVRPFDELLDQLEAAGFDAERRTPLEQRSAGAVGLGIAIYVAEKLVDAEIERLATAVRAWATTRLRALLHRNDRPRVTIPIYGPDGEVLNRVEIDED